MPTQLQKKPKGIRSDEGAIAIRSTCLPKAKHLYHKCEDGSGLMDWGLIISRDGGIFDSEEEAKTIGVVYKTVDEGRIWEVTVYDTKSIVEKYPPKNAL